MTTFRTGVEFGTNVGVLERDYQRAATASGVFGEKAQRDLASVTVAEDKLALASQRVVVADARLKASREQLNAVMASGVATQREITVAQSAFVASQERLVAAQSRQTAILREQQAVQATAARGVIGRPGGGTVGLIAGFAATAVALKVKDSIEQGARAASGLQAIDRQLGATLASTNDVAGTSVDGIDAQSQAISRQTGISEEATRAGDLLALTFTQVRNEGGGAAAIFERTQRTAANMAIGLHEARGGAIDFQDSVRQLARALNDPVAGMTLLTRSGVSFTRQQKEQIKALAESGQMLQAQELILDLVNQKFANAAANYGDTAAGAYDQAREAVNELERSLASPVLSTGVPILHALRDTVEFLVAHPAALQMGEFVVGLTGVAFAAAAVQKAFMFLRESTWATAILRILFPLRSVERQLGTLVVAEDAEAVAASRGAEAQTVLATSYERTAIAARGLAAAQAQAAEAGVGASVLGDMAALRTASAAGPLLGLRLGAGRLAMTGATALSAVDPVILASLLAGGDDQTASENALLAKNNQLASQFTYRNGRFYVGNVPVVDRQTQLVLGAEGGAKGQPALNYDTVQAIVKANPKLFGNVDANYSGSVRGQNAVLAGYLADVLAGRTPQQQKQAQNKALTQATRGVYGTFDLVGGAPSMTVDNTGAFSSLSSAQSSSMSAQRSLQGAEERLQHLRSTGKATTYELDSAERSLASARDRAAAASDRVSAAEKKVHDARKTTALTVADVLKRERGQEGYQRGIADDLTKLATHGVSQSALAALQQIEQQNPGTIHNFAENLNGKVRDELNSEFHKLRVDARVIAEALTPAFVKAAIAAAKAARVAADAALSDQHGLPGGQLPPQPTLPRGLSHAFGGWTTGQPGALSPDRVHGGEYVLSRDMLAGRQPVGVGLGMLQHSPTAAQQVVVHVHTAAPTYTTRHEWHNTIKAGSTKEFEAWADQQARVRSVTP